jgi:hypothetical protein
MGGAQHAQASRFLGQMGGPTAWGARLSTGAPELAGYLGSTSVKMSVSPIPVRAIAVFRPSVQTG